MGCSLLPTGVQWGGADWPPSGLGRPHSRQLCSTQLADHKTAEVFPPVLKIMYRVPGGVAVSCQTKACRGEVCWTGNTSLETDKGVLLMP